MSKSLLKPQAYLMSGDTLIATLLRRGGGKAPLRWEVYWSIAAEQMARKAGAAPRQVVGESRREAMADAIREAQRWPGVSGLMWGRG